MLVFAYLYPTPICTKAGLSMLSRCPSLFIQPSNTCWALPCPAAMFSANVPPAYPAAAIRAQGEEPFEPVCEKKSLQAISSLWLRAAVVSWLLEDNVPIPRLVRSWLIRFTSWLSNPPLPDGEQDCGTGVDVG